MRETGRIQQWVSAQLRRIPDFLLKPVWGIMLGAAISLAGPHNLPFKSACLLAIAVWLIIDLWAYVLHKSDTSRLRIVLVGWTLTNVLLIGVMGVMYLWLAGALQEQQDDVYAKLDVLAFMPDSRSILRTGITVTNNGGTDINDHRVTCWLRRVPYFPYGGLAKFGMATTLPKKTGIKVYGDAETSYCLAGIQAMPPDSHAVCADITVAVSYSLITQPATTKTKQYRFVADGEDFVFHKQPIEYSGDYCPEPTLRSKDK